MNIKHEIIKNINTDIDKAVLESLIQETADDTNGSFCIPCFSLAKELRQSPMAIAETLKNQTTFGELIEKAEVVNGYLNFFLNRNYVSEIVINEVLNNARFFKSESGNGKTVCFDYSSINLAKYMHVGHLSTTIIGESLARIYENAGYNVVRLNYIGDYGTPFGKMVAGYKLWNDGENILEKGIDFIQDIYVKFNKASEDNEEYNELAKQTFKLIEEKDPSVYGIYEDIIEVSKLEAKRILDNLGITFDSWRGEASYSDKLDEVVRILNDKNILEESNGAKIVDLSHENLGVCLIQKNDGTSLYATRDIAAAIDRYNTYKFDKMIYVTAVQQRQHFQQFFKVLEMLEYPFAKNLEHVYYGMFSLPTGKIASRYGRQAVLTDLSKYLTEGVTEIVKDREYKYEDRQNVIDSIAKSTLKFNAIKNERIKDTVFDIENSLSFEGDTVAYMQYTYTRICSILRRYEELYGKNTDNQISDINAINNEEAFKLVRHINNFTNTAENALMLNEPSVISKYMLALSKLTNKFYATTKVLEGTTAEINAKINLLKATQKAFLEGFNLTCIDALTEM